MATSLANTTSTRADSSSRHMLQCRVHKDRILSWTATGCDQNELLRNKHKYGLTKDELALDASTPMYAGSDQYARQCQPYPLVLSSFHGMGDVANDVFACLMDSTTPFHESLEDIFKVINTKDFMIEETISGGTNKYIAPQDHHRVKTIPHFRTMGYSVGTAYAHESTGDTMAAVMIGGISTVLNGAFPMQTGDRVMWYLTKAEQGMFNGSGVRISGWDCLTEQDQRDIAKSDSADDVAFYAWDDGKGVVTNPMQLDINTGKVPAFTYEKVKNYVTQIRNKSNTLQMTKKKHRSNAKNTFNKQHNGMELAGNANKTEVALVKPFYYSNASDGDHERVFAVCLSPAAPFEMVDIMISRQSL